MTKTNVLLIPALLAAMALVACGDSAQQKAANSAQQTLQSDGSAWTQVKIDTRIAGYSVFLGPDGKYYAIDVSRYVVGMTKDQLMAAATVYSGLVQGSQDVRKWGEVGSSSYSASYCPSGSSDYSYSCSSETDLSGNSYYDVEETDYGYYWDTETIYTDKSSGVVFEVGDTSSKDLAAVSGAIEKLSNDQVRNMLVMSYGLSEDRAQELASLSQSWNNVSKSRTMTSKDMVEFQSKVFGADLGTISSAAKKAAQGDDAQYNSLLAKAAALNNISPEQANSILQGFAN